MTRRIIALAGATLALTLIIGLEAYTGLPPTITAQPVASIKGVPPSADAISLETADGTGTRRVATILARPIFSPDRRPIEHGVQAVTPGLTRLAGVIVSPLGKTAIFAAFVGGKAIAVGEGGRVGAFFVEAIEAGVVLVTGPGGQQLLRPTFDAGVPPRQGVGDSSGKDGRAR
jgi:hypothetical protein